MRYISKNYEDRAEMLEDWAALKTKLNPIYGFSKKAGKYGKISHQIILESEGKDPAEFQRVKLAMDFH